MKRRGIDEKNLRIVIAFFFTYSSMSPWKQYQYYSSN